MNLNMNPVVEINTNTKSTFTHQLTMSYLQKDLTVNEIKVTFDGLESWPEGFGGLNIGQMLVSYLSKIIENPEFLGYKASLHRIEGNKLVADYKPCIK